VVPDDVAPLTLTPTPDVRLTVNLDVVAVAAESVSL
jgi:hypothetical protein